MRPKRRRSRPKGSKPGPPPAGGSRPVSPAASERGQPVVAPSPPPEPSLPPEPLPDPRVGELQDQVTQLTQRLEGLAKPEGGNVDERFEGMEERMKSLLQLSEILSVRYNPFLEEEEPALYDDHSPEQFLPESPGTAGPGSRPPTARKRVKSPHPEPRVPEGAEVVPMEPDPDVPMGPANVAHADDVDAAMAWLGPPEAPVVEAIVELDDEVSGPSPAPVEEAAVPRPPPVSATLPPAVSSPDKHDDAPRLDTPPRPATERPAWPAHAGTAAAPRGVPPGPTPVNAARPAPPRSAYFALCWFERLAAAGDPSEIHLFLDHYERLGWIPEGDRAWMRQLALGIAPPREDLSWDDLGLTGPDLARLHRDHLRLLEKLFRTGLAEDSPEAWERQADHLLGGR